MEFMYILGMWWFVRRKSIGVDVSGMKVSMTKCITEVAVEGGDASREEGETPEGANEEMTMVVTSSESADEEDTVIRQS